MGPKELTRKEREYLARRDEILQAALKLFSEKGYHQTSMSEIAKEAEFSIGSLYGFFKNKEELFFTLIKGEIEEIESRVAPKMSQEKDPRNKLRSLADSLFNYFEERWQAFTIFTMNHHDFPATLSSDLGKMIHSKQMDFLKTLTEIANQGIEQGIFRPLRPEEMALAFQGLINGSVFLWIASDRNYSLKERIPGILDIFYRGVLKS